MERVRTFSLCTILLAACGGPVATTTSGARGASTSTSSGASTTTISGGGATPCNPKTCFDLGFDCGPADDGCGNAIDCGTCTTGETCGGGGKPGVCGAATCAHSCTTSAD